MTEATAAQPAAEAMEPATPTKKRTRSTIRDQEAALRVLGVLKVATATQIQALERPHLADNKPVRNALLDLALKDEVESEGSTAGPSGRFGAPDRTGEPSQKLWVLKPKGLDAAARLLKRKPEEMGGRARGAGRGGAPHAMAVNATVVAFTRGGVGDITSWRTEVPHALASSGKQNVRPDAVLRASEAGVPLLMVEVDLNTEPVERLADKLAAYAALYRRRVHDPAAPGDWVARKTSGAGLVPYWETLYPDTGLTGWPPLAFVFTGRGGPRALANRMQAVADLSREHWAADEHRDRTGDFYLDFTGKVPLVLTTLERLQQHGPHGPVWQRVAQHREGFEPLLQALADPDTHTLAAYWQRKEQRDAEAREREEAERAEARAELQRMWDDDEDEDEPEEVLCANPNCEMALDEQPDENDVDRIPIPIPPEDGTYCWMHRVEREWSKPGMRGALRRMWNQPSHQR
ncbi:replication-relaxation family protein [Streptomyces sp. CA-111067]|uniref:replication-relaxation family protein n=1 Tax=Streptomyces sp. CA-111067 TaxID=3240046 RepID=UPI003D97EF14